MSSPEFALPPEGFVLVGAGAVLDAHKTEGLGYAMAELDAEFAPSEISGQIDAISAAIIPHGTDVNLYDQYHRNAIRQSSMLVIHSFIESNLPEPIATNTLRGFRVGALPANVRATNETARLAAFERFGQTGITRHVEAHALADTIQHYFDETTCDIVSGKLARRSVGASLHLLDMAWEQAYGKLMKAAQQSVAPEGIDAAVEAAMATIDENDWTALLTDEDAGGTF